jgi:hypothetical protein
MTDSADTRTPDPADFVDIAHRIVWCTLATVDTHGRPRSRLVHPVWEMTAEGLLGRVCTRATPTKRAHLAVSPYASCSYWDSRHDVAVAECAAEWDPDPAVSWPAFSVPPPPAGFDPATIFPDGPGTPGAAVILLRPWRLRWGRATDLAAGQPQLVWRPADRRAGSIPA